MRAIRNLLRVGLVLAAATFVWAQPADLDFERGQLGKMPPGWFVPTAGYTATLTDQRPHKGKRCALLESGEPAAGVPFGNLMRAIDATPYLGKRVRLRAAVRCAPAGPGDRVQMWMRVDREGGQRGFFDNMGDRPIRSKSWRTYEIEGNIAADARSINVGFMLMRSGRLWMDDVTLEVVGEAAPVIHDPPRPLEGRALENLVAFTKLLGYLRYFHPSDEAADADWNGLAVSGVRAVEPARDPRELARQLEELFRPIAPTVRVFPVGRTPPVPDALEPAPNANKLRVRAWRHRGVGTGEGPGRIYRSWRATVKAPGGKLPKSFADPSHPWVAELGAGVACMVPLALFADERGTLPHAADKQAETDSDSKPRRLYSGDDRETRLADVALAWNVFQHFYPYFDVVDADWAKTLRSSLTSAAIDADERAFLQTLRRMVADLHDGHGRVMHASDPAQAHLPVLWDWVEEQLVITAVAKDAVADVKPGDIVRRIDGRKPEAVLADAEELISGATPQWRRFRALRAILAGEPGEQVALQIERGDADTRTVNLRRAAANAIPSEARPDKVAEPDSGIFYVDLDRIESADFQEALPKLAKARGIVFDLRGYPRTMEMLAHLTEEPLTCAQWLVPKVREPDRRNMTFRFSNWPVQPKSPHFSARVAFVTDARAISFAETLLGIVEHYKLAEIVGGPTAGTNGNVNPFSLPGGYRVMWTGMKVLKHDGSRHHGVGILPTVPISRTIRGIREGRDELLDRAVAIVSK